MNRRLACVLGVVVLGAITVVPAPAAGQDGPYYPLPSWDQTVRGTKRFVLVMPIEGHGFQAVLDRETGLVWQRVPTEPRAFDWLLARSFCRTESTGGRQGWRLPSVEELSSLLDLTPTSAAPGLPVGHPFDLRQGSPFFWSASVSDADAMQAYVVTFVGEPDVLPGVRVFPKGFLLRAWCVRGGQGDHP